MASDHGLRPPSWHDGPSVRRATAPWRLVSGDFRRVGPGTVTGIQPRSYRVAPPVPPSKSWSFKGFRTAPAHCTGLRPDGGPRPAGPGRGRRGRRPSISPTWRRRTHPGLRPAPDRAEVEKELGLRPRGAYSIVPGRFRLAGAGVRWDHDGLADAIQAGSSSSTSGRRLSGAVCR